MKHRSLAFLSEALRERARSGLLRMPPIQPYPERCFTSNDYLGLAQRPIPSSGPGGAGASRLVAGNHPEHDELEHALQEFLRLPGVLAFTSGYAANVGTLAAIAGPDDRFLSDQHNHASLIDGMRLARSTVAVFPHNDTDALAERLAQSSGPGRTFIVTESYFGMDADTPDLSAMRALADQHQAYLVVDETHALGLFGPGGRGILAEKNVVADVLLGALGKSFGLQGGFAAGAPELRNWLWNAARSFVFSTGLSPHLAHAAAARVAHVLQADEARTNLHAMAAMLRDGLAQLGAQLLGTGPIIPWVLGHPERALELSASYATLGFHVHAMRPPTVPKDTSRLRIAVTASHTPADITAFLSATRSILQS